VQHSAQERSVDFDFSIVADEPELAEPVHEKTDAGSRGADHVRQRFLIDIWTDRLRAAFLSEMREQKEKAREPLLARIEQLVDQILFNPAVPGQEIRHEHLGKLWLVMKKGNHGLPRDRGNQAPLDRRGGSDTKRMTVKATLAEELTGLQNRDYRFLALLGQDSELDPPLLNVKYCIGGISLRENVLMPLKLQYCFPGADFAEKNSGIESVVGLILHARLLQQRKRSTLTGMAASA
jgi:hypothetical protein